MKTIGLVGGIASGKSLVAEMLVDLGAALLDGDRTGHAVLAEDPDVHSALRERWGDSVFAADGSVNRSAIAKRVFGEGRDAEVDRRYLESLLHPRIRQRLDRLREQYRAEGRSAVVLDAPILLEAGWGPICDVVLMVDCLREVRLQRALRRGWSEEQFVRREQAQWPVDEKRRAADVVIQNDGTETELHHAVVDFWRKHVSASN
jgi:dephospho-CoA kinase